MTGDEAYFIYWGVYPDYGFWDHPPWSADPGSAAAVVRAEWVLRLPAIVLPAMVALAMLQYLGRRTKTKPMAPALAFLLLPVNVWNVLITTDTPLVLFSFLSVLCFAALCGANRSPVRSLGRLSRTGIPVEIFRRTARLAYLGFVLTQLAAGVAGAGSPPWLRRAAVRGAQCVVELQSLLGQPVVQSLHRNDDAGWLPQNPPLYALSVLYMLCPVALYQLWRGRAALGQKLAEPRARFFMFAWAVPLAVFALLSLLKQIGLHWLLSFVPSFFVAAALLLSAAQLNKSVVYLCVFSAIHVAVIVGASLLPMETWKSSRLYDGIVFHVKTAELLQRLEPYAGKYELSADGFSPAVTASYASGKYFFVFGTASSHGRTMTSSRFPRAGRQEHPGVAQEPAKSGRLRALFRQD